MDKNKLVSRGVVGLRFHRDRRRRRAASFLIGFFCGCLGVLADLDHLVCVAAGLGEWDPAKGVFGCRLFHPFYLLFGWWGVGAALSCVAGWIVFLVYDAARPFA